MSKPIEHIFLDDGGVINDNTQRGQQWPRLVGEYFAPLLGGTPEHWAAANRRVIGAVSARFEESIATWDGIQTYRDLIDAYNIDWLSSMAVEVGADLPPDATERLSIAETANEWIQRRVHAAFPGAIEAVMELSLSYTMFTASMGASWELAVIHEGTGLRDVFQTLYGPDLVGHPKQRGYYEAVFAHAGVDPATALVLDDKAENLAWAREAGARTILVSSSRAKVPGVEAVIPFLSELPGLMIAKGL